jgi:hypothetical protein
MSDVLGGISLGEPQPPQIAPSVQVLQSLGGIVDAAATVATRLVGDLDRHLGPMDPALRAELVTLVDAVYDLDIRTTRLDSLA